MGQSRQMSRNRKLASIQYIHDVTPIEGADRIELAHVLGWQCVVNKGQFKPGDLGVYFEIDSFLPVRPEFEFMRSSSYKNSDLMGEGFHLRTMKFRGQISQGLLMPITVFQELSDGIESGTDWPCSACLAKEDNSRSGCGYKIIDGIDHMTTRMDYCPLAEVPELHGDLIDRQKLLEDNKHLKYPTNEKNRRDRAWAVGFNSGARHCNEHAVYAKTVIEAEGE